MKNQFTNEQIEAAAEDELDRREASKVSDVSKTNEALIAEARKAERAVYLATEEAVAKDISRIIKGLADALATRVPVQGEPNSRARQIDEAAPDAREHLHAKCDCVPDLGPAHCHLCTGKGAPVKWEDCEAVREIADAPEPVDVVLTTADIEKLAHLLVQLSPATQRNSGATVRRLMQEMNIKEREIE